MISGGSESSQSDAYYVGFVSLSFVVETSREIGFVLKKTVFSILSKRAAGEVATGEGLVSSYDGRGECSKMPTLREIVIFFSVDCKSST